MTVASGKRPTRVVVLEAHACAPAAQRALYRIDEAPAGEMDARARWQGLSSCQATWQASDDLSTCLARCRELYSTTRPRAPLSPARAALRRFSCGADVLFKKARDPERAPVQRAVWAALLTPTLVLAPVLAPLIGGSLLSTRARFEAEDKVMFDDRQFRHDARRALRRELNLLGRKLSYAPPLGATVDGELEDLSRFFFSAQIGELKLRDPMRAARRLAVDSLLAAEKNL